VANEEEEMKLKEEEEEEKLVGQHKDGEVLVAKGEETEEGVGEDEG